MKQTSHHNILQLCDLLATKITDNTELHFWESVAVTAIDWNSLFKLANQTKTLGLLNALLKSNQNILSRNHETSLKSWSSSTENGNLRNLAASINVSTLLRENGIDNIVFKGPIHTHAVYNSWSIRASFDVDILVRSKDYENAKTVLRKNGYFDLIAPKSRWWNDYLGETAFQNIQQKHITIDLHHQVQQPGGPYPKNTEAFFENSVKRSFGRKSIKVLSPEDSLLITVICYGKALRASETWVHYAHEIAYSYINFDENMRQSIRHSARSHGLERIYEHALRDALVVFGLSNQINHSNNARLETIKHAFGYANHHIFFRTFRLWTWLDGNVLNRTTNFVEGLRRVYRSQKVYKQEKINKLVQPLKLEEQ